ncbi:hypothetical protein [Streptomyces sp. NPDC052496]|uniref:hypothetical protein n=1 Tax=Streptomyces sp. NPDC052496 TaxID=3154951 RepID=UPI00342BBECE
MKTVVITEDTDGIGRGLARIHLKGGGWVVAVGTDKAEPGAWFVRTDLELIDENRRLIDRLSAELVTVEVLALGARFQRSRRTETADGLEFHFVNRHPAIRYVNNFPGTVATSFPGDYDEAETAQISRLRATGEPVETAAKEVLPFLDSGTPGRPVAVSEGVAVPLARQASSPACARWLYDCTREVLAR